MRNLQTLRALFPETRINILTATLLRPEKRWFLSELATHLGTSPSSLQREVDSLGRAGVLTVARDGRKLYTQANKHAPIYADLRGLLEKTAGISVVLERELAAVAERISYALIYGSVASKTETPQSDVDVMVVGTVGLADLIPHLRRAEKHLSRPVNATVFSLPEFRRKLRARDHFLRDVLGKPLMFLKGTHDDLAALAGER